MLSIINETWKKLPRCETEKTMRQSGRLRTKQKRVQESASHSKTPFGEIVARLEDGNAQKIGMYGCKMKGYQGISGWGLQMPRRKRRPHPTRDQLQMDRQIPLSAWKVEDGQRMFNLPRWSPGQDPVGVRLRRHSIACACRFEERRCWVRRADR